MGCSLGIRHVRIGFSRKRVPASMETLLRGFPDSGAECVIGLGEVSDPTRFGIAKVTDGKIEYVVEKPKEPPSNLAIRRGRPTS